MRVNRQNLLIISVVVCCILVINMGTILFFVRDVGLSILLGDIPVPPTYADKIASYNTGWILIYDTMLTSEALKEYYLAKLPEQNWSIEYYSTPILDCILAKRNQVVRVIEISGASRYTSRVQVRFDGLSCKFADPLE
jgi:hypothetical protein